MTILIPSEPSHEQGYATGPVFDSALCLGAGLVEGPDEVPPGGLGATPLAMQNLVVVEGDSHEAQQQDARGVRPSLQWTQQS